ncbi:MAG: tol-pal system-associated acyl-CoA thioesterase [Rhodobiaceae bacterium]|nr:tol-pal system-associated acyl-CoA thioesterase [Rhodobiaceae bacterium]
MSEHRMTIRIYYEDTDFSGLVYHASYLRFMERGRTEILREVGVGQQEMHAQMAGLAFVVRRMTIDFKRPARMDDLITVVTVPAEVRGASMLLQQRVERDGILLVSAEVQVAVVDAQGQAQRIPPGLRERLGGGAG